MNTLLLKSLCGIIVCMFIVNMPLTNLPPANRAILVELECKHIWCSPGVWEVKVNRPSEPY